MKTDEPKKIYLKDYQAPAFAIEQVALDFDLQEDHCLVTSTIAFKKLIVSEKNLFLDGEELELMDIALDGKALAKERYSALPNGLEVKDVPNQFQLKTTVRIHPEKNSSLEGLYRSNGIFCTQCEPQGFRKVTYFLDRPDVMTMFTVRIEADAKKYPVMLSNGDRVSSSPLANGRMQVCWKDPFKKPAYLFALVAGDLGVIKDTFKTQSGRDVALEIYAAHGEQDRCRHAMESLKKSMRWDEQRFGREYDLGTYMIVATNDFNAGAMENKGLNIFNSKLVLADPSSATDDDYFDIESVVAHEYFHNWTGNRITLRDWFHLSLKEGLTVFRDQEFSMDMTSRSVVRIDSVVQLRDRQFPEDAGPNAHAIRPDSCFAVDNFFTPTIYEKGAEVIRMMQTLVGRPGFRKGMDLYFERHDGQAVVIEDFARAIADANHQKWEQFKLWYSQAGTPHVKVSENYSEKTKTYELSLEQWCAPTPHQSEKLPFHIPLCFALLGKNGNELKLESTESTAIQTNTEGQKILHLTKAKQLFKFENLSEKPTLSLNRQFSAPIYLDWAAKEEDLLHLLSFDGDDFNRWEAGQKLLTQTLLHLMSSNKNELMASEALLKGLSQVLQSDLHPSMKAMILQLPSEAYLLQLQPELNASAMEMARNFLELKIAEFLKPQLLEIYKNLHAQNDNSKDNLHQAQRRLKNLALQYLSVLPGGDELAYRQFAQTKIMTDQQTALIALSHLPSPLYAKALDQFYQQWKTQALVINKWFAIQAQSQLPDTFEQVVRLWDHADFNKKNPNRVYSLLYQFGNNLVRFHDANKSCYDFMAQKIIELDKLNPQVATRVAGSFNPWRKLPTEQRAKAQLALEKMLAAGLSKNTYEIVQNALAESSLS
jgi:aminopeptidase N